MKSMVTIPLEEYKDLCRNHNILKDISKLRIVLTDIKLEEIYNNDFDVTTSVQIALTNFIKQIDWIIEKQK